MVDAGIEVASREGMVVLRITGRATFKLCRELRELGTKVIDDNCCGVVIDLAACEGMDSTFMGVLAMIGIQGRGKVSLVIVNANDQLRELLNGIGLSKVWAYAESPVKELTWKSLCSASSGATDMSQLGRMVLEAHETLMQLDEQNIPKFQNLVDMLSQEMSNKE